MAAWSGLASEQEGIGAAVEKAGEKLFFPALDRVEEVVCRAHAAESLEAAIEELVQVAEAGEPWWAWAQTHERGFTREGGTMHMAVGRGFPEAGSRNISAIHWDFICDMRTDSEIHVDGELFYKNGAFVI